jgi:hypothetical protein
MRTLQAYREEFFAAFGCERDETRLTADLNNSMGDEHGVALSIYHQNPMIYLSFLPNCVQQSWLRSTRNQKRVATARLNLPVAAPAFAKPPAANSREVTFQERGDGRGDRGERNQRHHGGDRRDGGNRNRGDRRLKNPRNPKSPMFACQLCKQEGHWVSRCPLIQQASLLVAPNMVSGQLAPPPAVPKDPIM